MSTTRVGKTSRSWKFQQRRPNTPKDWWFPRRIKLVVYARPDVKDQHRLRRTISVTTQENTESVHGDFSRSSNWPLNVLQKNSPFHMKACFTYIIVHHNLGMDKWIPKCLNADLVDWITSREVCGKTTLTIRQTYAVSPYNTPAHKSLTTLQKIH